MLLAGLPHFPIHPQSRIHFPAFSSTPDKYTSPKATRKAPAQYTQFALPIQYALPIQWNPQSHFSYPHLPTSYENSVPIIPHLTAQLLTSPSFTDRLIRSNITYPSFHITSTSYPANGPRNSPYYVPFIPTSWPNMRRHHRDGRSNGHRRHPPR